MCKKYLIGSIYIPSNFSSHLIYEGLSKILHVAANFDGFVLGGDLNSKNTTWGDTMDNNNGKVLDIWLQNHALDVVRLCDNKPSYPNGGSFLDHFLLSPNLVNIAFQNFKISTLASFSDHFPIKLELQLNPNELILQSPRLMTSYKNTNWAHFR